ncbi:MAG TPA: FAD-dependent oxidoreductase [Pseudolabrys sp.]|nr:FAD-dependent oxidoreductase [Pseudolabrys sp.]
MAERITPDICVIGGGSGAASLAMAAAAFGVPVAMVARRARDGHRGRVASLLAAAKRAAAVRTGAPFGVTTGAINVDFAKVRAHVQRVADAVAPNEASARLAGFGIRVIEGDAAFKDRRTLMAGDAIEIRARRFVIATGSTPALPQIPGLDQGPYLTSETVFDLAELPEHLIVIGAGSAGLEMAQAFRRLGSAVTVLDAARPLAGDDAECAAIVVDQLAREGAVIRSEVTIARIEYARGKVQAIIDGGDNVEATQLLVAAGRKPALDGLNLAAAGIVSGDSGIRVNKRLRTSNKRVYAIGDVGQPHAAAYHANLALRNVLWRSRVKMQGSVVPRLILTDPELAQVGMNEAEARQHGIKFVITRWPYNDNDRAQAERETRGHIKVITSTKGKILGAAIVGAQAGELIAPWALAVAQGLNIGAITDVILPSPTLSDLGKSAALSFFMPRLTSPWVRRIIAGLRIFG